MLEPSPVPVDAPVNAPLRVSIVAPVYNEEGACAELAREIDRAFLGIAHEIIFVDDASQDATLVVLRALKAEIPQLRVLQHHRNAGQSRAVRTGILAATAPIVVTLDGDGQNDPKDAPKLVNRLESGPATLGLVGGQRLKRQDSFAKRWASTTANRIRKRLLQDRADDTGCGLKAIRREVFLRLPYFDHIHRYLPALVIREGYEVDFVSVSHRPRTTGRSKYTNLGRLMVAIRDLLGVMWLIRRAKNPGAVSEI